LATQRPHRYPPVALSHHPTYILSELSFDPIFVPCHALPHTNLNVKFQKMFLSMDPETRATTKVMYMVKGSFWLQGAATLPKIIPLYQNFHQFQNELREAICSKAPPKIIPVVDASEKFM
jgi:hypothetical protein